MQGLIQEAEGHFPLNHDLESCHQVTHASQLPQGPPELLLMARAQKHTPSTNIQLKQVRNMRQDTMGGFT